MKALKIITAILFVVCIPTLLFTTNLRLAANDIRLYVYGFNKYNVSAATGLSETELHDFAGHLITYFNSDEEYFATDLYNQRELAHLKDVKGLIRLAFYLQIASATYIAAYLAINFALRRGIFWKDLANQALWGSVLTVALLAALAFWAATDFDSLFLLFHLSSFRNDLWLLNPGDTMLLMFPQGFFYNAALFVAAATIVEAVIIVGIAWGIPILRRRRLKEEANVGMNGDESDDAGA